MVDYNPMLFQRYILTGNNAPPGHYLSEPSHSYYGLKQALRQRWQEFGEPYMSLLMADYIVKVRINTVVIGEDTVYNRSKTMVNVSCDVLKIFKGQHLPENCSFPPIQNINSVSTTLPSCLNFGYPQNWGIRTGFGDQYSGSTGQIATVQAGEEYYVTLGFLNIRSDNATGNFGNLTPTGYDITGGLFKITDGAVQDPDNFWGLGTTPTVSNFEVSLNQKISTIKLWKVQ